MTDTSPARQAGDPLELLLHTGEAWRNWRALLALGATATLVVLALGAGSAGAARGNILLTLFATLVAMGVLFTGISAAGVLLMDQAAGATQRSLRAASGDGLFCALRFVLLAVGAVVLTVLLALAVILVLFLGKIPALGPLLYVTLFPLLALASALYFAAVYLFLVLAGPALWSGASLHQALARLYALITRKPLQAVVGTLLLSLLVLVLSLVLFGAASSGVFFVAALGAPILDYGAGFGAMMPHEGATIAGMIGAGLVYALVGAAVFAVMILGSCHVYLYLTADMDFSAAEAALDERMRRTREQATRLKQEAERRAREAQGEVRRRAEAARGAMAERVGQRKAAESSSTGAESHDTAAPADTHAAAAPANAAPACPACGATVEADDAFCANCGHRLPPAV